MSRLKIISIVGARPQFIKAAAISRATNKLYPGTIEEIIVHSGQHYDDNMSRVFFEEMSIPEPKYNLEVGSGTHGYQTAEIMRFTEKVIQDEKPAMVLVYGDTNTTLGGALAASKIHIPVAHIEAGLRSYNKSMPEEINRIAADHVSTLLFSPTQTGIINLAVEGFDTAALPPWSIDHPGVFHCGDVMYDNVLYYSHLAETKSKILDDLKLRGKEFVLCTIHRDSNTDSPERLSAIMASLDQLSRDKKIEFIIPLHPRTIKMLPVMLADDLKDRLDANPYLRMTGPVTYFDMLLLEKNCRMIITDSGGVQKESYFFHKSCLVLRSESEWKELVDLGTAAIVDAHPDQISKAFQHYYDNPPKDFPPVFGDGHAAEFILDELVKFLA